VATGKETRRLGKELGQLNQLLITPDGKRLICGGDGFSVWDLTTGKELGPAAGGHRTGVGTLLFSRDGRSLATVDHTRGLALWDLATGKPLGAALDGQQFQAVDVCLAADRRELIALGIDATVRAWDSATGRLVRQFSAGGEATTRAWGKIGGGYYLPYLDPEPDRYAVLSRDGRSLAVAGEGGTVHLWDAAAGKEQGRLEHPAEIATMAFSPGGHYLATQDIKDTIRLWDTKTGKDRPEFQCRKGQLDYLACFFFSPDDKLFGWDSGAKLHLRDLATGKELAPPDGRRDHLRDAAFLRGSQFLACWGDKDMLGLWDVAKGALVWTPAAAQAGARRMFMITTPDGALAYYPVDVYKPTYSLRDALTGREICQTKGWLDCFAVSPDGRVLAQAGSGIVFRELATGAVIGRIDQAHRGRVKSLAFSPDGRTLATGGWDTTILVWDWAATVGLTGPARPLAAADLEAEWAYLAGPDAARACKAIGALAGSAEKAVPFLRERLRPATAKEQATIQRWVADLDRDEFEAREAAGRELTALGREAEPILLKALTANPSAEARVRIERVLSGGGMGRGPSESLRRSRAVWTLERIGNPAARALLEELASGVPEARLTDQAKASLGRLAR
jgi:WD40 repeat protein